MNAARKIADLFTRHPAPEDRPALEELPQPDPDRIQRLEWDVLRHAPDDGSRAAEEIAREFAADRLRATCRHEDVIETTTVGQAVPHGMCQTCGASLVMGDGEQWRPV